MCESIRVGVVKNRLNAGFMTCAVAFMKLGEGHIKCGNWRSTQRKYYQQMAVGARLGINKNTKGRGLS